MVMSDYVPDRGDLVWLQSGPKLVMSRRVSALPLSSPLHPLDWQSRQAAFICKVPHQTFSEVITKLELLLR